MSKARVLVITSYSGVDKTLTEGDVEVVVVNRHDRRELTPDWLELCRANDLVHLVDLPDPACYKFLELLGAPLGRYWDKRGGECDFVHLVETTPGRRELIWGDDRECLVDESQIEAWCNHTFFGPVYPPEF